MERFVSLPIEGVVDDDALRDRGRVVRFVADEVVAAACSRVRPRSQHRPFDRLRVRIDQGLARIEAVTMLRRPGPVDAVAVALPGAHAGQVAVPVAVRVRWATSALLLDPLAVEEAQLDALRVLGEGGGSWIPRRPRSTRAGAVRRTQTTLNQPPRRGASRGTPRARTPARGRSRRRTRAARAARHRRGSRARSRAGPSPG